MSVRQGQNHGCRVARGRPFSLFEVILVVVLLGILLAAAAAAFGEHGANLAAEAAFLRVSIRYAQSRAMGDTVPWGLSLGQNSYTLVRDGAPAGQLPGEGGATRTLAGGVTVASGTGTLTFDAWGAPYVSGAALRSAHTITLAGAGGASRAIVVTPNTGFVR